MNLNYTELLNQTILGNRIRYYILFLAILLASILLLKLLKLYLIRRVRNFAESTSTNWDDILISMVEKFKWPFFIAVPVYISTWFIKFSDIPDRIISTTSLVIIVFYGIYSVQGIIDAVVNALLLRTTGDEEVDRTIGNVLKLGAKILLWTLALLLVLQNLGVNVTAVLGGLGITGIAVAFAFQNVLSDMFSFFSIYFDKPFEVGDYVVVGDDKGTVEKIGLKSTRLRSITGEELVLPNAVLTGTRINNFKKMKERRVEFNFGTVYDLSNEQLVKIPKTVEKIVRGIKGARFDRCHFKEFGDFSLNFETIYFVLSPEYTDYMDIQQKINLELKEKFERDNIEFAYPTQVVYIEGETE